MSSPEKKKNTINEKYLPVAAWRTFISDESLMG